MKILCEDFDREGLIKHIKHYIEYFNDDRLKDVAKELDEAVKNFGREYNKIADNLAQSKAGKALSDEPIVGYLQSARKAAKWNRNTGDFVVYDIKSPRYRTYTLHNKTEEEYLKTYDKYFYDELPENKN